VILNPDIYDVWLDHSISDIGQLEDLMKKNRLKVLEGYPVSPRVNSVQNNDPSLIQPCMKGQLECFA
jgi:putative SOS response-associated peptidase YedK